MEKGERMRNWLSTNMPAGYRANVQSERDSGVILRAKSFEERKRRFGKVEK